jgi:hypothetical protein
MEHNTVSKYTEGGREGGGGEFDVEREKKERGENGAGGVWS